MKRKWKKTLQLFKEPLRRRMYKVKYWFYLMKRSSYSEKYKTKYKQHKKKSQQATTTTKSGLPGVVITN